MVRGKSFNTEHKLNKYKHIKPMKKKRRGLGSDRNEAACREVEELTKAGILRKDGYPLSEIDWKVESLSGFRLKCFLDAYKGYHQIRMDEEDEDKIAFFAGKEIGRNLEAYVDDMVIKSMSEEDMLQDIQETFDRFRSVNMKLNPKKCSFGVKEGPFLGHFITKQGIRANPLKFKAGAEKSIPFFKVLKSYMGKKTIQWTADAEESFRIMKEPVEILPTLTTPIKGEVLVMYLAASVESISAVLLVEREEKQVPIYFVSRVLQGAELNYPAIEKLILALAIELGEHDIEFGERGFRKTQILKDFSIQTPPEEGQKAVTRRVDTKKEGPKLENIWKLYTDRASSSDGSGT
ncbi:reverse transcriptase domain-containing protein [Tanacetum coccineum]